MLTVCDTEGAPQAVRDAVQRWFAKGRARLNAIADDIERLGE